MTIKPILAALILASFTWPAMAQSVGGPNRPKSIGGPTVQKNPVVAPPRSASPIRAPAPVKPVVAPNASAGGALKASPGPQPLTAPRTKTMRP